MRRRKDGRTEFARLGRWKYIVVESLTGPRAITI